MDPNDQSQAPADDTQGQTPPSTPVDVGGGDTPAEPTGGSDTGQNEEIAPPPPVASEPDAQAPAEDGGQDAGQTAA